MSALIEFAAVLFAAGCVIAFAGDRLGTYVGKRRLSRFGLRPKHTAMLYTTCSGGLIALVTVLFLFKYDHGVQYALVHGRQLAATIRRQGLQIAANVAELAADKRQLVAARDELDASRRQLASEQAILADSQAQLRTTRAAVTAGIVQLAATKAKLGQTRDALTATSARLAQANGDLTRTHRELQGTERQLASVKRDFSHEQMQVARLRGEQAQLAALSRRLASLNAALEEKNNALSTAGMVFRNGQEVDRLVLSTSATVDQTKAKLGEWLTALNHRAAGLGVGAGSDGRALAVEVDVAGSNAPDGQTIPQDEIVESLARSVIDQAKVVSSIVVVAKARVNIVAGQPGRIALYPYDNVLLFNKNQKIASISIDGRMPTDQILSSLQGFLTRSVRPAAQSAGVIPTYDQGTGRLVYGSTSTDWMSVVRQIQTIGSNAVVTAVAANDTYTAGPLQLSLVAVPADNSAYRVNLGSEPADHRTATGPAVAVGAEPALP